MSAMRDMSRAIRQEIVDRGPTLQDLPADVLHDYISIIGAFLADLRAEAERRADTEEVMTT